MSNVFLHYSGEYKNVSSLRNKLSGEWSTKLFPSTNFYIKENGVWGLIQQSHSSRTEIHFGGFINTTPEQNELAIICEDEYVGKYFYCTAQLNGNTVYGTWSITSGSSYASINQNGRVDINSGIQNQDITIQCVYSGLTAISVVNVSYDNQLTIEGANEMSGTQGNVVARYNSFVVTPTWSIISGSTNATIDSGGTITILSSGTITVQAVYAGLTQTKDIDLTYENNTTSETVIGDDGSVTTITTVTTTGESGETIETSTATTRNDDGSQSTTSSETTTYQDGSSTSASTTTNQDGSSTESEGQVNTDGSSSSTTTNYDPNGDPTSSSNNHTDSGGNSNTQDIVYENGEPVVTGYTIDTTSGTTGGKTYSGDGVSTEYYAFDVTHGFVMDFNFTFNFSQQPSGQNENHHNILSAKRAAPEPWYGLQIRQSGTNKFIQLGTQFDIGGNVMTQIQSAATATANTSEYNLKIIYDPTASSGSTFICQDLIHNTTVFTSNYIFPDLEELRYLKITLGYAVDANGDPYRYSNINVLNFNIRKLINVSDPVISCDGQYVSISSETQNADIYYKVGSGSFTQYTVPFEITADTVVQAYAELNGERSNTVTETCIYDNGVERPTISCDGEEITIACSTPSVDIYYRLDGVGSFSSYTDAITITADTIVEAYSELNGLSSVTVTELCEYSPIVLVAPVISCDGENVTITCATQNAVIYYKEGQGNYEQYTSSFAISADTVIQAYSTIKGRVSSIVTENCIYNPTHDYSQDYLTFRVLTSGTIAWNAFGSGYNRVIEYSINNGTWTSITASTSTTISVSDGDVVRFRGTNTTYAGNKSNYDGFEGGTAAFNIEGNIMSLIYGDNFTGQTTFGGGTYNLCSIFKKSNVVSAENLILPVTTLTNYCYRAMFSLCPSLVVAPELPAMTLAQGCYWYMFEGCPITRAPELSATTLVRECYGNMFTKCNSLNYIKCLATNVASPPASALTGWVTNVAARGTFVKDGNTTGWTTGNNGIPTGWVVNDDDAVAVPVISYDGFNTVTITCATQGADIYYNVNRLRSYILYTGPFTISDDSYVEAYSEYAGQSSYKITQNCVYVSDVPFEASNRDLEYWTYNGQTITPPYSVNQIDGHSSSYAKGTFNFETTVSLREAQPTYLWFQHADQSADIYVDNVKVETHWGGYNAFFSDISNYVHSGSNVVKVALCNTTRETLAPAAGDFNFNATLGNVKLFTSPYLPSMNYGYDGFHVTSTVSSSSATVNVATNIPSGATVICSISGVNCNYTATSASTGSEMIFTTTITNPRLWNGTIDAYLYEIKLEIYHGSDLYHRYVRPYGLRYYSYVINDSTVLTGGTPYTGFLLNGEPYLLRGVCMHDDLDGKANALNDSDYEQEFSIIQELGCNFIRLAHYPHPKEVYDRCDQLGIIVQTEVPCVNKLQSTYPSDYYTHLEGQYDDMVNQHYNHPCIMFWGLSNETTTDDKSFGKTKIDGYTARIKALDSERLVGYVMSHSYNDPLGYYNNPNVDWVGTNIYVGWYISKDTNDPTSQLNTRITNTITNKQKALAFSEYGAGGTQHCHSDDPQTTTTKGNYARHDIEYQMWLHEGHIAAIRNFPQLLFTAEWQLFDIAVSNRNEGYTVCLDGENTSYDDSLRRLNDKGLVERDHITKKDTFYIYKAEWSSQNFVHICGKDYTKTSDRVIKCYTNDGGSLSMYVNNTFVESVTVSNNIVEFTARNFSAGDIVRVEGSTTNDTFTFAS